MSHINVTLDGLADLERMLDLNKLTSGIARAVGDAAALGVEAEQARHPYKDRTYNLTSTATVDVVSADPYEPEVDMFWPAEYAGYVDDMSEYAFTPEAVTVAENALEYGAEAVVDHFIAGDT